MIPFTKMRQKREVWVRGYGQGNQDFGVELAMPVRHAHELSSRCIRWSIRRGQVQISM